MNWRRYQPTLIDKRNIIDEIHFQNFWKPTKPLKMIGLNLSKSKPPKRGLGKIFPTANPGVNAWARENVGHYLKGRPPHITRRESRVSPQIHVWFLATAS